MPPQRSLLLQYAQALVEPAKTDLLEARFPVALFYTNLECPATSQRFFGVVKSAIFLATAETAQPYQNRAWQIPSDVVTLRATRTSKKQRPTALLEIANPLNSL